MTKLLSTILYLVRLERIKDHTQNSLEEKTRRSEKEIPRGTLR